MIEVIDSTDLIFNFFNDKFTLDSWQEYASSILSGLDKLCFEDSSVYDYQKDIYPLCQKVLKDKERLIKLQSLFIEVTKDLNQKVNSIEGNMPDIKIILYLGLCNGAGWATKLNNDNLVLLGIEKIFELDWDCEIKLKGLIYHELGHIYHDENRKVEAFDNEDLYQLYSEGMAMIYEQCLCNDLDFYHQYDNKWKDWCKANLNVLAKEYLKRVENKESVQDFFGDWSRYLGHSDIGYYLGTEVIKNIKDKNLLELANLKQEKFIKNLYDIAK